MTTIPIRNVYYLLSYAWNHLDLARRMEAGTSDFDGATNLFAKVLLNGLHPLLRRGLHRDYRERTEAYAGVRGRLLLTESLARDSFRHGYAICSSDTFTADNLHNQLLKAALHRLLRAPELHPGLNKELRRVYDRFAGVRLTKPAAADFKRVHLDRNNALYDFLLRISHLIYTEISPTDGGHQAFRGYANGTRLGEFFEAFLYNFYTIEQDRFTVSRPYLQWRGERRSGLHDSLLPRMKTDIWLENDERVIIMDAKFYQNTLSGNQYGSASFHSAHLYQLFAYLNNAGLANGRPVPEGILLYPTVRTPLRERYVLHGFPVLLATIDLQRPWREIHGQLLGVV